MKAPPEDKAATDTAEPPKVLEAIAFLLVSAISVAVLAFLGVKLGDLGTLASKLSLVVAFAMAWIAKVVRIAVTRVLLPFIMLFVVVRDDKVLGVHFWAVGALTLAFAVLLLFEAK